MMIGIETNQAIKTKQINQSHKNKYLSSSFDSPISYETNENTWFTYFHRKEKK